MKQWELSNVLGTCAFEKPKIFFYVFEVLTSKVFLLIEFCVCYVITEEVVILCKEFVNIVQQDLNFNCGERLKVFSLKS